MGHYKHTEQKKFEGDDPEVIEIFPQHVLVARSLGNVGYQ